MTEAEDTVYPALRRLERDGEKALAVGREDWQRFRTAADAVLGS